MTAMDQNQHNDLYMAWQFTKEESGCNPSLSELKRRTWSQGIIVTPLFRAGWWPYSTPDPDGGEPVRGMTFKIEASDGERFRQVFP